MKRLLALLLLIPCLIPSAFPQTTGGDAADSKAFIFTAVWDTASNDITASTLQRIPLSTADYDKAKSSFIEEFVRLATTAAPTAPGAPTLAIATPTVTGAAIAVAGATPTPTPVPTPFVVTPMAPGTPGAAPQQAEIKMSLDPKIKPDQAPVVYAFDVQPVQVAIAAGNDPHALGEWAFYFWQNYLWQNYVSRTTLQLPGIVTVTDVDKFASVMQEKREPIWTWSEVDSATREPKEWVQSTREYPAMPLPNESDTAVINILRTQADQLGGQILDVQHPNLTESEMAVAGLMRIYMECAYALDAMVHDDYWGLVNGLRERQEQRAKYAEWMGDRQNLVQEYAKDWARKYDGTEFDVDGVQFLVSEKKPLENVPSNTRNIVVDKQVVPYDLLNDDGTLKRPIPKED